MRRLPVLLACVPPLALAACERSDVARVDGTTVAIVQGEYRQSPQDVEVQPGRITFTVRNESRHAHNWQLRRGGRDRARISTLLPGETGRVTVRLRRGTYRMICGVGHHEELGEHGTVTVR